MVCRCGEPLVPIFGYYPDECAVCRLMRDFPNGGLQARCDEFEKQEESHA